MALISVALLGGAVLFANYEDWFVRPKLIEQKRGYAAAQMKDPGSAQFRNEKLTAQQWLCGEMNVKNGMGAYAGFVRFIAGGPESVYVEGIGYAGQGSAPTNEVLENIKMQTAVLKERNRLLQEEWSKDLKPLTDTELHLEAVSRLFKERWERVCP